MAHKIKFVYHETFKPLFEFEYVEGDIGELLIGAPRSPVWGSIPIPENSLYEGSSIAQIAKYALYDKSRAEAYLTLKHGRTCYEIRLRAVKYFADVEREPNMKFAYAVDNRDIQPKVESFEKAPGASIEKVLESYPLVQEVAPEDNGPAESTTDLADAQWAGLVREIDEVFPNIPKPKKFWCRDDPPKGMKVYDFSRAVADYGYTIISQDGKYSAHGGVGKRSFNDLAPWTDWSDEGEFCVHGGIGVVKFTPSPLEGPSISWDGENLEPWPGYYRLSFALIGGCPSDYYDQLEKFYMEETSTWNRKFLWNPGTQQELHLPPRILKWIEKE